MFFCPKQPHPPSDASTSQKENDSESLAQDESESLAQDESESLAQDETDFDFFPDKSLCLVAMIFGYHLLMQWLIRTEKKKCSCTPFPCAMVPWGCSCINFEKKTVNKLFTKCWCSGYNYIWILSACAMVDMIIYYGIDW